MPLFTPVLRWEKTIQKPQFLRCNPGFPKCLGRNPGFSLHPELRIFKVCFSTFLSTTVKQSNGPLAIHWCCNSIASSVTHEGLMGKLNEYDLPGGIPHTSPWVAYLLWCQPFGFKAGGSWIASCCFSSACVDLISNSSDCHLPQASAGETKDDALDSMKWVEQIFKLLLHLNSCYEQPNFCLCFMKDCSCCNCLGGNWSGWHLGLPRCSGAAFKQFTLFEEEAQLTLKSSTRPVRGRAQLPHCIPSCTGMVHEAAAERRMAIAYTASDGQGFQNP